MPKPMPIIILGTGGSSIDILDAIRDVNDAAGRDLYKCVGFLDDDESKHGQSVSGLTVLGPIASAAKHADARFINGISSPTWFWKRDHIIAAAGIPPERFETIVHPRASVSRAATVGRGVAILAGATVCAGAHVGDHVTILPACIVSHDCRIGDYTTMAGGACVSGSVRVGRCCYLGTRCAVREKLTIGDLCLVGMGSVVLSDVPENTVVVGNPARALRKTREEGDGGAARE